MFSSKTMLPSLSRCAGTFRVSMQILNLEKLRDFEGGMATAMTKLTMPKSP
jgi:hypothetical protein